MSAIDGDKVNEILAKLADAAADSEEPYSAGCIDTLRSAIECGLLNCTPEPPPPPATPEPAERKPVLWVWRRTTGVWEHSILTGRPNANHYIPNTQDGWCPLYE